MEFVGYLAVLGAALAAGMLCLFLVTVLLRSRKIPQCFSCGAMKVRPSRSEGFWDTMVMPLMMRPYRCGGCRARFYGFRSYGEAKKSDSGRSEEVPNNVVLGGLDPSNKPKNRFSA